MPYPQRLLNDNEEVALDIHPHWWFLAPRAAAAVVAAVAFFWALGTLGDATWESVVKWILAAVAVLGLVRVGLQWLRWRTTHFVITSDRLIARSGVLAKRGIEIPLERVNNVSFTQTIFERAIKAGDLLIESGGEDGQQRFTDILRPDEVQNLIHLQMEENQRRTYSPSSANDVATQLEKLEGLRDRGAISDDEFRAEKRRLLG